MIHTDATASISRRRFLRTAGGLVAGSAALSLCPSLQAAGGGNDILLGVPQKMAWRDPYPVILWNPGNYVIYDLELPNIFEGTPPWKITRRYVSVNGSDANAGDTAETAWRTMSYARMAMEPHGGGVIVLDGNTHFGWGNVASRVPIEIEGNGSILLGYTRTLRFGASFRMSNLTVEGGEVFAFGNDITGIVQGCTFRNSSENGFIANGTNSRFYVTDSSAYDNPGDGFSYSSANNDTPVYVFEAYNYAANNGSSDATNSDQGSTCHGGVQSIRLGCTYTGNNNNVSDVANTRNMLVECIGQPSRNRTINLAAGYGLATVRTWVYGGSFAGGAVYDISVGPGSVLYTNLDLTGYRIRPYSNIQPLSW